MKVRGVLWHSTGANNPTLRRYVQPSNNDPNRQKLLNMLGTNKYGNDWNHQQVNAGLNCWIGQLANGNVTTVQTMPWNFAPWGCASGPKGSCNDGWIQFEICEDALTDPKYFNAVYKEACEITAYLCKMYNIDPFGTVNYKGVVVPTILCHQDSYQLGLGNNHGDIYTWFRKHGKDMKTIRADVAAIMNNNSNQEDKKEEEDEMTYYKTLNDVPAYYKDAIQKAIDKGALKGTGNGELNVSEDLCRTLTVLDRLGKLD